ncbi:raftlin-2 isoform X2 [Lates japonicus]|uniref:Raftlin-2 isoform X2 n=1 Tax=Lates japonicus TaxID=270547 RepID=A0AAD3MCT9_LATJO|nr:raftlin-2 isoform X2 [Lates japonicus]
MGGRWQPSDGPVCGFLSELPQALQPYYTQGYVLAALHPIILFRPDTPAALQPALITLSWLVLHPALWAISGELPDPSSWTGLQARGGASICRGSSQQVSGITNGRVEVQRGCQPSTTPSSNLHLRHIDLGGEHLWSWLCSPDRWPVSAPLAPTPLQEGSAVSASEVDWLELTAAYYRKGWPDSFTTDTLPKDPVCFVIDTNTILCVYVCSDGNLAKAGCVFRGQLVKQQNQACTLALSAQHVSSRFQELPAAPPLRGSLRLQEASGLPVFGGGIPAPCPTWRKVALTGGGEG